MSQPKKERKYIECFKSIKDGSCNHCKERSWQKGYKIYAMKKPDEKWLACTDKECYLEQGGELTIFKRNEPEPSTVKAAAMLWKCTHCNHGKAGERMLHIGDRRYHRVCLDTIIFQSTFEENWKK